MANTDPGKASSGCLKFPEKDRHNRPAPFAWYFLMLLKLIRVIKACTNISWLSGLLLIWLLVRPLVLDAARVRENCFWVSPSMARLCADAAGLPSLILARPTLNRLACSVCFEPMRLAWHAFCSCERCRSGVCIRAAFLPVPYFRPSASDTTNPSLPVHRRYGSGCPASSATDISAAVRSAGL